MNPDMDRLLVYRNLLAAIDHLEEINNRGGTGHEVYKAQSLRAGCIFLQDRVMPEEKNPNFHCVVKHLATAYEGAREVAKATRTPDDEANAGLIYDLLVDALGELWGRKVTLCERCHDGQENLLNEGSGDTEPTIRS